MSHIPAISIIVPIYNVEAYLPCCLDRVLAQSFEDFELICIDDGSEDNSGAILDDYAQRDDRIVAVHQPNHGLAHARNRGLALAGGEYIAFLDSDDYWHEHFLATLHHAITCHNADFAMCDFEKVRPGTPCRGAPITPTDRNNDVLIDDPAEAYLAHRHKWGCYITGKLYRRAKTAGWQFPPAISIGDDLCFNLVFQCQATLAVHVADPLYYYVQRPGSITTATDLLAPILSLINTMEWLLDFLANDQPQFDRLYRSYLERYLRKSARKALGIRPRSARRKAIAQIRPYLRRYHAMGLLGFGGLPLKRKLQLARLLWGPA